jgi:hypothetical protein
MAKTADTHADSRFDEAEADVDYGTPWLFREPDAPNPLTIEATQWSKGMTKLGEAEFLQGVDREGKKWSVLVGSVLLIKRLIDGTVEEWNNDKNRFVVTATEGRVQPGEIVSIKYVGDREGAQFNYPDFRISRKPPLRVESDLHADTSDFVPTGQTDEIPF